MPLYSDSVIFGVFLPTEEILGKYGAQGVLVSETNRPSCPIDVWVVEFKNADLLLRYRGEYKLGIIASDNSYGRSNYRCGDQKTVLQCLDNNLSKSQSEACRLLSKLRDLIPKLENGGYPLSSIEAALSQEIDYILNCKISTPSETIPKKSETAVFAPETGIEIYSVPASPSHLLTEDDVKALSSFEPYKDLFRRFFALFVRGYGLSYISGSLEISDLLLFEKTRSGSQLHHILSHLNMMGMETELQALKSVLSS